MGRREHYEPGTFSWTELSTTDPGAAKEFYGALFGWTTDDIPIPDGSTYTIALVNGDAACALQEQRDDQRQAGVPPNWFNYVATEDADASAATVKELGGAVHAEPFDVMDQGRMAVLADPTGAMFGVWQAQGSNGAVRVNDPGCMTSNELSTNDVPAAIEFYSALFGWEIEEADTGGGPRYWLIKHDGAANRLNGGMRELAPEQEGVPPYWIPYFTAESLDALVEKTKAGGGQVHAGPIDIPAGRIAVIGDPQGAIFGVFEGDTDD